MTFTVKEAPLGISATGAAAVAGSFTDLARATQESFWVLGVNSKLIEISRKCLFVGGLDQATIDLRVVYRYLLTVGASRWIAVHNHPSGDPAPSKADRQLTTQLKCAGAMLGLELADSIIIGDTGQFYSAAEAGELY